MMVIIFTHNHDDHHEYRIQQRREQSCDLISGVLIPGASFGAGQKICPIRRKPNGKDHIMRAYVVDRYKKKGALRLGETLEPTLRDEDVLVETHAAGLNLLDSKIRDGEFKLILPYRPPFTLGHDVAGTVVRVGSRVRHFKPGDEIYARPRDGRVGTFADFIAMNEADVALKPKNLTMEEAASVPLVGLTAWQVLVERANLKKGQKVLIHAGSGGVGTFAIQLAKHLGATVATTTSTANIDLVRSLGADVVVDYKKDDFEKVLSGYDVVLNGLDSRTLQKSLNVLKPGGKLISISGPPDPDFAREQGLNWFLRLILRFVSFDIRKKSKTHRVNYSFLFMRANGAQLSQITSLIEAGIIRPVMDRVFPFEATNDALAYVETGRSKGKIVVRVK
jgi:NADPH:quinone reductase-like Zn-dependent oxidoreductase